MNSEETMDYQPPTTEEALNLILTDNDATIPDNFLEMSAFDQLMGIGDVMAIAEEAGATQVLAVETLSKALGLEKAVPMMTLIQSYFESLNPEDREDASHQSDTDTESVDPTPMASSSILTTTTETPKKTREQEEVRSTKIVVKKPITPDPEIARMKKEQEELRATQKLSKELRMKKLRDYIKMTKGNSLMSANPQTAAQDTKIQKATKSSDQIQIERIDEVSMDLAYSGFDITKTREACKDLSFSEIIDCLMTYACCGNNFRGRLNKANNKEEAHVMLDFLKDAGFKAQRGRGNNETLTLSRVATAYSPLYLKVRTQMIANGSVTSQHGSCPLLWQDLALAGHPHKPPEYKSYYAYMNKAIAKGNKDKTKDGKTDADYEEDALRWIAMAETGFKLDSVNMSAPDIDKQYSEFKTYYNK